MGERKGTNKWYPPDFDPAKHGSLNGYWGTHALRERARKLDRGILIIRFEMPYNIWCDGCNNHVGMGVRYNAEKSKIGMYYTTPIWKFRMKCHLCDNHYEIKTDPANQEYEIISGARRVESRWAMEENEQILPTSGGERQQLGENAMFRLEHGVEDQTKAVAAAPSLSALERLQAPVDRDYDLNCLARSAFRADRKRINAERAVDQSLLTKSSLPGDMKLLPETDQDKRMASLLCSVRTSKTVEEERQQKRSQLAGGSIFAKKARTSDTSVASGARAAAGSSLGVAASRPAAQRGSGALGPKALELQRRLADQHRKKQTAALGFANGCGFT